RVPLRRRAPFHPSGDRAGAARWRARVACRVPGPVRAGPAGTARTLRRGPHPPRGAPSRRAAAAAGAGPVRRGPGERRRMTPVLLLPLGLAALAALALPLLLHLARRQIGRAHV